MKNLQYLALFILSIFGAIPASAQWFYDNVSSGFTSGTATLPWVNTTSACNPPGVTNLGVTVTGAVGGAVWLSGWDGVNDNNNASGSAIGWQASSGNSYTLNVTGSVTINSITFGVRRSSNGAPTVSFKLNGTSYTPSLTNLSTTNWFAETVTVSPAVTVTAGTVTIMVQFTGGAGGAFATERLDELKIFGTSAPAPVELTDFTVKPSPIGFDLNWETATEHDNDYFSIERSTDGHTFTSIGQVKGAGTTIEEQAYTFTDRSPLSGYNYYRLKQVDYDGKSDYSPVRSVKVGSVSSAILSPNPIQQGNNANLMFDSVDENDLTIEVFNTLGQAVLRQETTVSKGINPIQLDMLALPKGVYTLLTRVDTESSQSQQFIIQ
jgi:Secretion system C-terminal sorting domain